MTMPTDLVPIDLTIYDAEYIVAALREKAVREREDAEGKIHNAKLSRLDAAEIGKSMETK